MTLSVDEVETLIARSISGDADASLQLATHFHVWGDLARAEEFYVVSFGQGSSYALSGLADVHLEQGNFPAGIDWLKLACGAGHSLACVRLSLAYAFGDYGVSPDQETATYFLERTKNAPKP